jgi:sugar lactone lactonase YvrE
MNCLPGRRRAREVKKGDEIIVKSIRKRVGGGWSLAAALVAISFLSEATLNAQYTISPVARGGAITVAQKTYTLDGRGVAVDTAGNVYATAQDSPVISAGKPFVVRVNPGGGAPTLVAGSDDGSAFFGSVSCGDKDLGPNSNPLQTGFSDLGGIAVDGSGNLYVGQSGNGPITEIGGNTLTCLFGSRLYAPGGIAVDKAGNVFFDDANSPSSIYKGTPPFANGAAAGPLIGTGGNCTAGEIGKPSGLSVDGAGNLYIADPWCNVIWKVSAGTSQPTAVAGNLRYFQTTCANVGDELPATSACLNQPEGVAVDLDGNLYIADFGNARVRKVDSGTGLITTIAGNGSTGSPAQGVTATSTPLAPHSIAIGPGGTIYVGMIADASGNALYRLAPTGAMTISPAPGSVLPYNTCVPFTWTTPVGATSYRLDVSDQIVPMGQGDIFPALNSCANSNANGDTTSGNSLWVLIPYCNGRTIYVRLSTYMSGQWQTGLYTYTDCKLLNVRVLPSSLPAEGGGVSFVVTGAQSFQYDIVESFPPSCFTITLFGGKETVCTNGPPDIVVGTHSPFQSTSIFNYQIGALPSGETSRMLTFVTSAYTSNGMLLDSVTVNVIQN